LHKAQDVLYAKFGRTNANANIYDS
jgi:hypothetical protein